MSEVSVIQLGPEGEFERKRLRRLVSLQKSDHGFFLLAVHSFVESRLRQQLSMWEDHYSFDDLIFKFKISLIESSGGFPQELGVLQSLRVKQKTAQAVRTAFADINTEEAQAAAYRLIQFCRLAKIDGAEELAAIESGIDLWTGQASPDDSWLLFSREITAEIKNNPSLLDEVGELIQLRKDAGNHLLKIKQLESEIAALKAAGQKERADALSLDRSRAEQSMQGLTSAASALSSASKYLETVGNLTSYTRTRLDFERDITRLTPEQQDVLDSISLTNDFLIKGGAGTGKTLVLIKALEKAVRLGSGELDFSSSPMNVGMLTFNRTLAKYDRYIAELLEQGGDSAKISTIDKFLYDRLRLINPGYKIIFEDDYLFQLVEEAFKKDQKIISVSAVREIAAEIEGFTFAAGITSVDDYINNSGQPGSSFTKTERTEIWNIREKVIALMHRNLSFTKNFSRQVILDHIAANPNDGRFRDLDFAFIDEVQDLCAVDIRAVKACTSRAVVMAGDSDQSIYRGGFSFVRAGIDIRGNTRILKTNFRNSIQIQETAEKYRLKSKHTEKDVSPRAFRSGPPPEFYTAPDEEKLIELLMRKAGIFLNEFAYDPENICILVPGSRDVDLIKQRLAEQHLDGQDLRTDEFSFSEQSIIRISTMHSSKGLDFPVVLLLLNRLPQTSAVPGESPEHEKMLRNLIYVSMTRAMDHLNVFISEAETSPAVKDLADCFS